MVEEFFDLENAEKMKYDVDEIGPWKLNGYTPFGRNKGLVGDGKKHGVEGYTVTAEDFLALKHRPSLASTTCLTIQRYPLLSEKSANAGLASHTDVGSLTILFCGERGLQALSPDTKEWQYVEPKKGCAVINVGDSLRFLSNKTFRSALHRVVPYPGMTIKNRFSCAYFIRPNLDTELLDEDWNRWKSIDWHVRKYKSYRSATTKA
ncbi:putative gibberellin 2-beta-dioxygenase 7 [Calycina marina]|uniref:Gibberellin 2-beta-dioxygenase 7 n=1 Tax=Calycina marina TaxID=1763456 RepID=A0A9P7YXF9_9HELO|nr:putative gibberellin 2-beta-dioxygenase 7 [Calycina marina]